MTNTAAQSQFGSSLHAAKVFAKAPAPRRVYILRVFLQRRAFAKHYLCIYSLIYS